MLKYFLSAFSLMVAAVSLLTADFVYVTNPTINMVSVIDTTTGQVSFIQDPSFDRPAQIAITPDGKTAFVTNSNSFEVSVIDTATNTVRATVTLTIRPFGVAISPDGSVACVANEIPFPFGRAVLIDVQTLSVTDITDSIPHTFNACSIICFAPDSKTAYVTNTNGNSVSIIDVATAQVTGKIIGSLSSPVGISITPDGSKLYVANENPSLITILSTLNNAEIGIIGVPAFIVPASIGILLTPDGSTCYDVIESASTVAKINTSTNSLLGTITIGGAPLFPAIGTDLTVYVTNGSSTFVTAFSNETFSITGIFDVSNVSSGIAVLPLLAPTSLTACQQKNVFLTQTDLVNMLSWSPPPFGVAPTCYNIYRDAALTDFVASVPANGPLQYQDHNRTKGQTYTYYVVSANPSGSLSVPAIVTVTQSCPKN